jgi:glycerate kinase
LGGSATADGGAGAAEALGVRFFDVAGKPVTPLGGKLREIHAIDVSALDPRLKKINLEVACDVDNPLLGPRGAARVFGPQKGASLSDVLALEEGLTTFFSVVEKTLGISVRQEPGAGAAGGLSAGLAAFAGARLTPGFPLLAELVSLAAAVKKADVVVTGEGALDEQTLMGKAPAGVADLARRNGLPVVAFCGRVADPHGRLSPTPFGKIWDLTSFAGSAEAAIAGSAALLERLAEEKAPALSAFAAQYSSNHRKP